VSEATSQTSAADATQGFIEAEPAQAVNQPKGDSRADRARSAAYHKRFVVMYVCLALIAGIGVGALVVSLTSSDTAPTKTAATAAQFTPSQAGELGAVQLAEDVQRKYRNTNGDELVGVVASRNTLQDGNLGLIRVRYQYIQPFDSSANGDSKVVTPTSAIQYSLCGTNAQCAIPGKASTTRFALLRRQGLELALRTFQNDSSVDNVSVFLRPVAPQQGWEGYALVFDRAELNRAEPGLIEQPLPATLPGAGKTIAPDQLQNSQISQIEKLTRPYLYQFRYQLLGGRDALMQLQPAKG
jgi:hypothetical protein